MKPKRAIIFDASSLISLAMNGLLPQLKKLKEIFPGNFIITDEVKYEVIDRPLNTKKFELEGLMLRQFLDERVLETPASVGIDSKEITNLTKELMQKINSFFVAKNKDIHIMSDGETSCIALAQLLDQKKIQFVLAIDERTARMLIESPENLEKFLERKMHTNIGTKETPKEFLNKFKIIRSAELMYVAYKKGLFEIKDPKLLDTLLWAVKFKGCSISDDEINEIKQIK